MIKVYIAAPFFNNEQLSVVKKIEKMLASKNIAYFSPRLEGVLIDMDAEKRKSRMRDIFQSNIEHLDWCTHIVAYTDGRDMGTVWELGYGYAKGKVEITFTTNDYGINVMINESIFTHCRRYDQIISALGGCKAEPKTSNVT